MPAAIAGVLGTAAATAAGAGAVGAGLAGAAASAAGTLISGALSSGNTSDAAGKAGAISQQAITDANTNRLTDRAGFQPYVDQGSAAATQTGNLLGLNGQDAATAAMGNFQASPGYQYSVDQGLRAVDSGAAANGMLRSGSTLKAEQTLGNNLANQDFGNYIGRLSTLSTNGLAGAQGQANTTAAFNNVLSGQSTNQEQILGQAATQQNSLYGNVASGLTSAVKSTNWNSLFGNSTTGAGVSGSSAGVASLPNGDGTYSMGY